jgi:hypothetical protein
MRYGWFLFSVSMVIAFAAMAFFYFASSTFPYPKPATALVIDDLIKNNAPLQKDHIGYFLSELGFYKLHTAPSTQDTPKIEVIIDDKIYGAEIIEGKINMQDGSIENRDIRISMTKDEIINALKSQDIKSYTKTALLQERIKIEQIGSYSQIISKGYISVYNEINGRGITGNVIGIFSE